MKSGSFARTWPRAPSSSRLKRTLAVGLMRQSTSERGEFRFVLAEMTDENKTSRAMMTKRTTSIRSVDKKHPRRGREGEGAGGDRSNREKKSTESCNAVEALLGNLPFPESKQKRVHLRVSSLHEQSIGGKWPSSLSFFLLVSLACFSSKFASFKKKEKRKENRRLDAAPATSAPVVGRAAAATEHQQRRRRRRQRKTRRE